MRFRLLLFSLIALALGPPSFAQQTKAGPFALSAANQCTPPIGTAGQATVGIQITGTFSATLQPEVTIQGQSPQNTQVSPSTSGTPQSTITTVGVYTASVAGYDGFLLCVSSYVSGTATVYLNASPGISADGIVSSGGGVTSVSGTTNQVTVSPTTGAAVVSLPTGLVLPGSLTMNSNSFTLNGGGNTKVILQALTPATGGANQNPSFFALQGNYWDGAASQTDLWTISNLLNSGTAAGGKLTIGHGYGNNAAAGPSLINFSTTLPLTSGSISITRLTVVGAPTVTPVSTGGGGTATTWSYVIVAKDINGQTANAGSTGTTAVGSSTLDNSGTQQNNLTWASSPGAASYDIYRTVAGGTPSTTGKIGNATTNSFSDVGTAGDSTTPPSVNTSGSIFLANGNQSFGVSTQWRLQGVNGGAIFDNTAGAGAILMLGGSTSSFPSIQRSGATIQFRLADSSADAAIRALTIQSSVATGTAPFTVASTTNVPNLNASSLNGATFASPGAIGGTSPSTGAFTTLSASSTVSGTGFSTYLASPPAIGGTTAAAGSFTTLKESTIASTTNCAAAGTAANPSAVACAAAPAGAFSCATNASNGTCVVSTTAITANSQVFVQQTTSESTRLSVTCNATILASTAPLVSAKSTGVSFTVTLPTFTTNPVCFDYFIIN
jgi:hypothetical protein